jgi:hypothetical protein
MQLLGLDKPYEQLFQQLQGGLCGAPMALQLSVQPIDFQVA